MAAEQPQGVEGTAKLDDGLEVYTKTWTANPEKVRVLFIHGFSDHVNNYDLLIPYLCSRGISVHAWDQRGFGRTAASQSQRGLTGPTSRVHDDITTMLRPLLNPAIPVFIVGHSMGGAEALTYSCADPAGLISQVRGTISLAPLIALHPATRPNALTVFGARLLERIAPRRQIVNKLDPSFLSHDEAQNKQWSHDPLNHDTGTLEGLGGMLFDRAAGLESGVYRLGKGKHQGGKSRVMVVHGDADRINDYAASKAWVDKWCEAEDQRFWSLKGWYHNLHCEPEYEMYRKGVADWILERSGPLDTVAMAKL